MADQGPHPESRMRWLLQAAKDHFGELVERARTEGPQIVSEGGKDAVAVMSVEEYRRMAGGHTSLVEFIRSAPALDLLDLDRAADRPSPTRPPQS